MVFRDDLGWLLDGGTRRQRTVPEPTVGATAEILEVLRERGACFAAELADGHATGCPTTSSGRLWDGVARGLLTSDGFGAIRAAVAGDRERAPRPGGCPACSAARAPPEPAPAGGRWSPSRRRGRPRDVDRDELAEAVAELLLNRWGVVFRDLALHDSLRFPWRDVQWALRRLEDRGLVRGGRFVSGFSGEQYALPAAVEQLGQVRKVARAPASGSP